MSDQLFPGCKLVITTGSGSTISGVLHSFDESLGKVVLKRVTTSGSRLCGLQNFYFSDMTKLQIIEETPQSRAKSSPLPDNKERNTFLPKDPEVSIQHHVMRAETINPDHSVRADIQDTENADSSWVDASGDNRWVNGNGDSELPDENADNSLLDVNDEYYETDYYTLIYRLGDKFYEAIDYIMGQEAVGVTFEGVDIGRNGILSVVQISTETDVIAFDVLELGTEAFAEGLQAVFESNKIVKVIHDCRWISDMLHEQFHIRAANIFDTQVANAYVYRILHNGDWPRYVESLPSCLVRHLKLQPQDVTFSKVKDGIQERPCQSPWLQRPLSKQLLSAAQRNVSYLGQLHQVLLNKMLYEFRMGVQIYMSHVRNMDGEIESCQKHGYLLPPIFWKIPELVKLTCGDSKGQNNTKDGILGKDLPAPERAFLGLNSVKPKPKEAACARDLELQDNSRVRNEYERNAYIAADCRSDRVHSLVDPGFTRDSYFSNGIKNPDPDRLRDKSSLTQEETVCRNHQTFNLPSSLQIPESHSRTENQKECDRKLGEFNKSGCSFFAPVNNHNEKNNNSRYELNHFKVVSQNEIEAAWECSKNENNLALFDTSGDNHKQNTLVHEQGLLQVSSEKHLSTSTHTNLISGDHADIVLPDNINLTSKQPSSDASCGIRRSQLWQIFHANGVNEKNSSRLAADLGNHLDTPEGLVTTDTEQDFLSKTVPDNDTNCTRAMPKLMRVHHNMQSAGNLSLSETCDCEGTPGRPHSVDQLHTSHLSRSSHSQSPSSDSESSPAHLSTPALSISRGRDLDCSSCLPAGFDAATCRKKKLTDQMQSHSSDRECESNNQDFLSASLEDDLCYIPMQGSLMYRQERPLGVTSFDFGDPLSDSECNVQSPGNSQFYMDSHQGFPADNASEDEIVAQFQKSEVFQKVLKVASSLPLDSLKSKLLPSKVSLCGK